MKMEQKKELTVIECSGSAYEIGLQYGVQAKDNINKAISFLVAGLQMSPFKADRETVLACGRKYLANVTAFDPEAVERVRGLADGAEIGFDEALAIHCYTELAIHYPYLAGMCTSFAATGPATSNGITMLGQNIDWHPVTPLDLLRIHHDDGLEQIAISFFGNPCYMLNSAGIGNCANLSLAPMGPLNGHVPLASYLFKAMRQTRFEDAWAILKDSARGVGYYHLADGRGTIMGIESLHDRYTPLEPRRGLLVHANHYETPEYAAIDWAKTYIADSFQRAPRLRSLMEEHYGALTPELMMQCLADHDGYPDSICRHVDESKPQLHASMSKASFIMLPAERRILICAGPPCENDFLEYAL
jgi:isopenicillin-N N-acyltransferase-like protein